ncbi:hypothetical protein O2W14_14175 [Modestobacter sp. VKM Ac-2986]|uniref:hypothetical protein n=1 Tax=Modestobacter sp. VKM Ac-2986 TaxID=3004140 RepID=UPI0022ABBB2B|nr:hypothetical protein [Modestobacter sp. VKM Ac-2986]MCZ2829982.1 hypothetical protein [Modestobacter sp. VKM Ac-2986]
MESNRLDRDDAAAQLAVLQADRAALADRVVPPWWYDPALGVLLFCFLASYAFDSLWVTFPAVVLFCAGLGALVAAYKRITGVWVSIDGPHLGVWAAVVLVVLGPAFVIQKSLDQHWVMVVAGAVLGVVVTLLGRHWNRAYAAELRGQR